MGKLVSKSERQTVTDNVTKQKTLFIPKSAICNVKYKNQIGTGAIYRSEFPEGTWRTLFITSHQVLEISDAKQIHELRLEFEDISIGNLNVTPDWVKWLWTSPSDQLNVTVIEFSLTALKILSRTKYSRLNPKAPQKQTKVTAYDPSGGVATGFIIDVSGEAEQTIHFKMKSETGSSGIPLFDEEFNAIGIHTGSWNTSKESAHIPRAAVNIQHVLDAFQKYVRKQVYDKTENELWKERIKRIPNRKFQFIGSGGYGKVYKIYDKYTSSELAIKIVGGFGNLNDHNNQVKALEKEYGIITSLDSHPRIIQFVALIRDEANAQMMILMEYMADGSLADKLKDQKPLDGIIVRKYFGQIIEAVCFLHKRDIFHSDIKPSNILFTQKDNLKLCDFGIAIESETDSSTTSSHMKGSVHYMSPERLRGNSHRSTANDIWSIAATFVQMKTGKRLNYEDNNEWQFRDHIVNYQLTIDGKPYEEYTESLSDSDFRQIISRTLCPESERANCEELLSIARPFLVRRIPPESLHRFGKKYFYIRGMSYNAARDELFLSDSRNSVVRAIRLRDTGSDLRDVYRKYVWSVCHLSDSDTLLVSLLACVLVALRRDGSEWREAHRVHTEGIAVTICALSDSRVLVGNYNLELLRVQSGPHIASLRRFPDISYRALAAATCGRDTLVAMSDGEDKWLLYVYRLHRIDYRLEELVRILLQLHYDYWHLLWLTADRLLATEQFEGNREESEAVTEFEWSGTRLERRHRPKRRHSSAQLVCSRRRNRTL